MSASPLRTVLIVHQVAEDAVNKAASRLGHDVPASVTVRAVSGIPAPEIIHASGDHHAACPGGDRPQLAVAAAGGWKGP